MTAIQRENNNDRNQFKPEMSTHPTHKCTPLQPYCYTRRGGRDTSQFTAGRRAGPVPRYKRLRVLQLLVRAQQIDDSVSGDIDAVRQDADDGVAPLRYQVAHPVVDDRRVRRDGGVAELDGEGLHDIDEFPADAAVVVLR